MSIYHCNHEPLVANCATSEAVSCLICSKSAVMRCKFASIFFADSESI